MHVYLITTRDRKEAFVYSNLILAKEKCKEVDGIAYEWCELWCRPIIYDSKLEDSDYTVFDDSTLPWEMLILAHEHGNWNARAKYREEQFKESIEWRKKKTSSKL